MSKGPEAFRTISEVAEELDLPQHVLRFWETRFTNIRPMKRGGGRRYYRPDDVDLLRGIRALLYSEGYTIRGVQRILKEQGPRFVISAARGEISGLMPSVGEEEVRGLRAATVIHDLGEQSDGDSMEIDPPAEFHAEPAFDPREFRVVPQPRQAQPARGGSLPPALSGDEIRRLQATIGDLLELKRLLDQARG